MRGTILFQCPWRCMAHLDVIQECVCLFHNRQSRGHLSLSFYIWFFRQHFSIAFQHVQPLLQKGRLVAKRCLFQASYYYQISQFTCRQHEKSCGLNNFLPQEGLKFSPFLALVGCMSFGLSLAFHFVFRMMVPTIDFYWIFLSKKIRTP